MRFVPIEDVSPESGESESFPHLKELKNGDLAASAIKQVASGRFGVTPEYLVSAKQVRRQEEDVCFVGKFYFACSFGFVLLFYFV